MTNQDMFESEYIRIQILPGIYVVICYHMYIYKYVLTCLLRICLSPKNCETMDLSLMESMLGGIVWNQSCWLKILLSQHIRKTFGSRCWYVQTCFCQKIFESRYTWAKLCFESKHFWINIYFESRYVWIKICLGQHAFDSTIIWVSICLIQNIFESTYIYMAQIHSNRKRFEPKPIGWLINILIQMYIWLKNIWFEYMLTEMYFDYILFWLENSLAQKHFDSNLYESRMYMWTHICVVSKRVWIIRNGAVLNQVLSNRNNIESAHIVRITIVKEQRQWSSPVLTLTSSFTCHRTRSTTQSKLIRGRRQAQAIK